MAAESTVVSAQFPEGFEAGKKVEHILVSVTVVHTNNIIQYDDSCARILERELPGYNGVESIKASVLYNHGKTEVHPKGCECHYCSPPQPVSE